MAKIKLNIKQDEQLSLVAHQLVHYADIVDIQNWDELLECYFSIKKDVEEKKVFLVLDDRSQAEYTSMHAVGDERLYIDYSDDLKDIDVNDPKWEKTYQNVCMPKQLQHYIQQLRRIENQCVIEELSKKMQHYDEDDLQALIYLNQDFAPSMDTEIVVKVAEIETESLKIAMMPNGYFTCDFDPFENFAIIQRMQHYGYEFIGLGAALLGWVKTEAFRAEKIEDLMQELSVIYPLDSAHQMALKTLILKNNYLILPYSESPQEYLGYDLT